MKLELLLRPAAGVCDDNTEEVEELAPAFRSRLVGGVGLGTKVPLSEFGVEVTAEFPLPELAPCVESVPFLTAPASDAAGVLVWEDGLRGVSAPLLAIIVVFPLRRPAFELFVPLAWVGKLAGTLLVLWEPDIP